jgi:uncharacterized SAM-binding protein YcdF (DUF218 family)
MTYLQPFFPVLIALTAVSILLCSKSRARRFGLGCAIALLLFSWQPVTCALVWPLERAYSSTPLTDRAQPATDRGIQAIVVLSSSVLSPGPPLTAAIPGPDTYQRCVYAAWLYRNGLPVPVLASGGGSLGDTPYAEVMRGVLEREGVPLSMIWTEDRSRSTYENALNSAGILREKGIRKIALVTEAYHMSRSERCFRKQGLEVVPAACGFRSILHENLSEFLPRWQAVAWNEDTMHEAIGILWYAVTGKI